VPFRLLVSEKLKTRLGRKKRGKTRAGEPSSAVQHIVGNGGTRFVAKREICPVRIGPVVWAGNCQSAEASNKENIVKRVVDRK